MKLCNFVNCNFTKKPLFVFLHLMREKKLFLFKLSLRDSYSYMRSSTDPVHLHLIAVENIIKSVEYGYRLIWLNAILSFSYDAIVVYLRFSFFFSPSGFNLPVKGLLNHTTGHIHLLNICRLSYFYLRQYFYNLEPLFI